MVTLLLILSGLLLVTWYLLRKERKERKMDLSELLPVIGYLLRKERKEGEMDKEPEVYELEPVERRGEELPEELLELFGLRKEEKDARGLIETVLANLVERKKIQSEIKRMRLERKRKEEILEDDRLDTQMIEARIQKLKAQFEAGLISRRQLELLGKHFPGVFEMVKESKELRKLKHLREVLGLEDQIAQLRAKAQRDGLEEYRERYRRLKERIESDLIGRHTIRKSLIDLIEKIAAEMKEEGRSEAEIEFLKAQLRRDVDQAMINLGEEDCDER